MKSRAVLMALCLSMVGCSMLNSKVSVTSEPTGVPIAVDTLDNAGLGDGVAPFDREYLIFNSPTFTAPATFGDRTFAEWIVNGSSETQRNANVSIMLKNVAMAARYTTNKPPSPTYPVKIANWGGRPALVLDKQGGVHIVVDSAGGDQLLVANVSGSVVSKVEVLTANTWNPATKSFFNPSVVVTDNGMELLTAWWFTANVKEGCVPRVLYRVGNLWKDVIVNPSPTVDWQPCAIRSSGADNTSYYFGFANNYYPLTSSSATVTLGAVGNYASGNRGGGEKESRYVSPSGKFYVCNSGCNANGGSYSRNNVSCNTPVMWASYNPYSSMGSDDTGHSSTCGDLADANVQYMVAYYPPYGLVYNVWDGGKLVFSVNNLPVLDKNGWAGMVKTFVGIAPRPGGGAYVLWTNGNSLYMALIGKTGNVVKADKVANGTIGALVVGSDGSVHLVYNSAGTIQYNRLVGW